MGDALDLRLGAVMRVRGSESCPQTGFEIEVALWPRGLVATRSGVA